MELLGLAYDVLPVEGKSTTGADDAEGDGLANDDGSGLELGEGIRPASADGDMLGLGCV